MGIHDLAPAFHRIGNLSGVILLGFVMIYCLRFDRRRVSALRAALIVLCVVLVPGTVYVYYLSALVPIVAFVLVFDLQKLTEELQYRLDKWKIGFLVTAIGVSLAPVPLAQQQFIGVSQSAAITTHSLVGLLWAVALLLLVFAESSKPREVSKLSMVITE